MRIGLGEDIHRLVGGRPLVLGGIKIPSPIGELAHSDGDVLLHALADAIYGAIAEGDIGTHFPDNKKETENMDSSLIVKDAIKLALDKGYEIESIDSNIFLEEPKLQPYLKDIRENISSILGIDISKISVKPRTNEGLGPVGEKKAVRASCIILLKEAK